MGKFNLNKSEEEPKKSSSNKFNLNKQEEPKQTTSSFSLNKQEEPKKSTSNNFNQNKEDEVKTKKLQKNAAQTPQNGTATQSKNKQVPQRKSSKWWLWLLLAAIIVWVFIMLVKNTGSNNADDADTIPDVPATEMPTSPAANEQATPVSDESAPADVAEEVSTPADEPETIAETAKPVSTPVQTQTAVSTIPQGTLEEKARQVIRGDFGNGQARKDALGSEYAEIQAKVNELMRK